MFRRSALLGLALFAVASVACGGASAPGDEQATEDEITTTYGDLVETLSAADLERWIKVRASVIAGFDRICGDTICSGDYSNLATVRLTCSSTAAMRKLKACTWVLGGSIEYVDGRTGKITAQPRVFECKIPVASTAKQMLDALEKSGDDALNTPLPNTGKSFYDGLTDCFSGVVGAPPPVSTADFYVELQDHLWSLEGDAGLAWNGTRRKINEKFNEICGDSFCEGEYPAIAPLRFVCSMNRNTKRVARCSWSFAGAETSVGAGGVITARTMTKTCNIEVGVTASELTAALSGDDPLRAKLPGRTTSIYDALIGCL